MCPYERTSLYISRVLHFVFYLFAILKDSMLSLAHIYTNLSSAHFKVVSLCESSTFKGYLSSCNIVHR